MKTSLYLQIILGLFLNFLTTSCVILPNHVSLEGIDLSREAFIKEMVIASKTRNTKYFNDYIEGSYHVSKMELINAIRYQKDSTTKNVVLVIIVGPSGGLWKYDVITVIDSLKSDSTVDVNHLVFPHARITFKLTKSISRLDFWQILERIQTNPLLRIATNEDINPDKEYDLSFVLATFGSDSYAYVIDDSVANQHLESLQLLYDDLNELHGGEKAKVTYD